MKKCGKDEKNTNTDKDEKKKSAYSVRFFSVIAALFFLLSATTLSYAWFRFGFTSGSMDMKTDGDASVKLFTANWAVATDTVPASYQWDKGVLLKASSSSASVSGEEFFGKEFSEKTDPLHFGTIDNLSERDKENIVWFCLEVKTAEGRNFEGLKLVFQSDPFSLYEHIEANDSSAMSEVVSQELKNSIDNTVESGNRNRLESLLCFDNVIISGTAPDKLGNEFFTQIDVNTTQSDAEFVRKQENGAAINGYKGRAAESEISGERYYIYFRAYPNLDAYAEIAEYISEYMPCVLQFNLQVEISVNNAVADSGTSVSSAA